MKKNFFAKLFPVLVIAALVLTACNLPLGGTGSNSDAQVQTLAAATIQAQVNDYLTQTSIAAPHYVVVTSTPSPTTPATNTPEATAIPPTPTATLLPYIAPTATRIPIPCNQAAYVTDVTVPDGTTFVASASFVKTWRVLNNGTCTWGSGYALVFYSGNSMSAANSVNLPRTVYPGQTVDISVSMTAPDNTGNFTGNWMLRTPNGTLFGVGSYGGVPLTVVIKVTNVPAPHDPNTTYDFVKNYCSAQWRTNGSFLSCPSSAINYTTGSITRTYAPILENGVADDEGAIISVPAKGGDGMIQGQFPHILIHSGDHFAATVLCSYQKPKCNVTFEVLAQVQGSSTITSLGSWNKTYNNSTQPINIDLSSMDGEDIIFYLKVLSNGDPTDDMAQWMAARITH